MLVAGIKMQESGLAVDQAVLLENLSEIKDKQLILRPQNKTVDELFNLDAPLQTGMQG